MSTMSPGISRETAMSLTDGCNNNIWHSFLYSTNSLCFSSTRRYETSYFYRATRMHSAYMPWQDVRPSVCLSVTRRYCVNRYRYPHFLPSGSPTILVSPYQTGWRYSDGNPPNGGVECKGYDKMTISSQISRSILDTVIVRWAHAARQL